MLNELPTYNELLTKKYTYRQLQAYARILRNFGLTKTKLNVKAVVLLDILKDYARKQANDEQNHKEWKSKQQDKQNNHDHNGYWGTWDEFFKQTRKTKAPDSWYDAAISRGYSHNEAKNIEQVMKTGTDKQKKAVEARLAA